jgi:hypothetical protein
MVSVSISLAILHISRVKRARASLKCRRNHQSIEDMIAVSLSNVQRSPMRLYRERSD